MASETAALVGTRYGAEAYPSEDLMMDVPLDCGAEEPTPRDNPKACVARVPSIQEDRASTSSSSGLPSTSMLQRPQLQVSVLAPEKTGGQAYLGVATSYTTYLLQTKVCTATLPSYPSSLCRVRRRFSDFDALYHALRARYAGYFVPKLPEKDLINGKLVASGDFVERRAEELQVFITRACNHEVLHSSKALELFLTLDTDNLVQHGEWKRLATADSLFLSFRHLFAPASGDPAQESLDSSRKSALAKFGDSVMLTFKRISDQVMSQISPDMSQPSAEEVRLREAGGRLQLSAYAYATLLSRWGGAMKALAGASVCCLEMGAEFKKLYTFEDRRGPEFGQYTAVGVSMRMAAADFQKVAYQCFSVGAEARTHVPRLERAMSPLRHVDSSMREGVTAYKDREQLYAASSDARSRLQEKRERLRDILPEATTSASAATLSGVQYMQREVKALEERLQELDKDYETVADINRQETAAAMTQRDALVPLAVLQVAEAQLKLERFAAARWDTLAQQLEKLVE